MGLRGRKPPEKDGMDEATDYGTQVGVAKEVVGVERLDDKIQTSYLVTEDENVLGIVGKDFLQVFPLFSRLMRTTNLDQRGVNIFQYSVDVIMGTHEMFMDEDLYETSRYATCESLNTYLKTLIHDSLHGWKLNKIVETTKRITVEGQRKKKGWLR